MIAAALMGGFAIMPGLPKIPFIVMGIATGAVAYILQREQKQSKFQAQNQAIEKMQPPTATLDAESVTDLLQVDTLEVEIGYGLIPLVESGPGTSLLNRITMIRRQVALELGFILPKIRIRDNLQLSPNAYTIKLRGEEVAQGNLMPNHYLAMATGIVTEDLVGIPTTEPAFGLPALWIDGARKERAETLGYTVVDAASVVATHLTEVIKIHSPEILTRQDTRNLLDNLKKDYPALVEDVVPHLLSLSDVQEVLKNLLRERIPIRDLVTILETVSSLAHSIKDPDILSEAVRRVMARTISNQNRSGDGVIHVLTLSPRVERTLNEAMDTPNRGLSLHLEPRIAQQLLEVTAKQMEEMATKGYMPVALCSAAVRLAFKRLVERALPNLTILSYSEIVTGVDVHAEGMIDLPNM